MRAASWSLLVGTVAVAAACTSEARPVSAPPEPPPVAAAAALAIPEAAPDVASEVAPTLAGPLAPQPASAPLAGPVPAATPDDNPLPDDAGLLPVVAVAARVPVAASAPRAVTARPSGPPTPTGRIEIPAIGLNHLTYEGIDLATIRYGPSHWPGKPLPGQVGNTVFPGHRTTFDHPFGDLDKMVPGNEVIFTTPAGRFTYRVTTTTIVNSNDSYVASNTPDATFTLLACHPKGSAKQRIVVKGKLVTPVANALPVQPAPTTSTTRRRFLGLL